MGKIPIALEKVSGSGITVDGVPLEDHVAEECDTEITDDREYTINRMKRAVGKRNVKCRIEAKKEPDGNVTTFPQSEINKRNYKENRMNEKTSMAHIMLNALLAGEPVNATSMAIKCSIIKKYEVTPASASSVLTAIKRTDVNWLLIANRKGTRTPTVYSLIDEAKNMTEKQIRDLYSKRSKYGIPELFKDHPEIEDTIGKLYYDSIRADKSKSDPAGTGRLKDVPDSNQKKAQPDKFASHKGADPDTSTLQKPIEEAIKATVEKLFGINVNVSGRVEIAFKWER